VSKASEHGQGQVLRGRRVGDDRLAARTLPATCGGGGRLAVHLVLVVVVLAGGVVVVSGLGLLALRRVVLVVVIVAFGARLLALGPLSSSSGYWSGSSSALDFLPFGSSSWSSSSSPSARAACRLGVVVLLVVLGASGRGRGPGRRDGRRRLAPPNRRSSAWDDPSS
jgi:hypothetical protein